MSVASDAVSFAGSGAVPPQVVAAAHVCGPTATAAATTSTVTLAPAGTIPKSQLALEASYVQTPWLGETESTTSPASSTLPTLTAGAPSRPRFETTIE